jgi:hypothetical protein
MTSARPMHAVSVAFHVTVSPMKSRPTDTKPSGSESPYSQARQHKCDIPHGHPQGLQIPEHTPYQHSTASRRSRAPDLHNAEHLCLINVCHSGEEGVRRQSVHGRGRSFFLALSIGLKMGPTAPFQRWSRAFIVVSDSTYCKIMSDH